MDFEVSILFALFQDPCPCIWLPWRRHPPTGDGRDRVRVCCYGRFEIQPPRVSSFKYTTNFCLVTLLSSYSRRIALLIHSSLVKRSPFGEIFFTSGTLLEHVTIMSLFFFSQNSHLSMEDLRDIYACSTSPVVYCFPNDSTPPPPLTHTLLLSVTILLLCS